MILANLRDRLMVGHIPLEDVILVRIQVPQQKSKVTVFGKNTRVASRQCFRLSEEKPRVFKIQKQGARREAGVP